MACNLNTSAGANNIEKCGGLPPYIRDVACHMLETGGVAGREEAIPAAVNFAKSVCAGYAKNFHKRVAPEKAARACAAVGEWKKLNACQAKVGGPHGKAVGSIHPMIETEARFTLNTPADVKAMDDGKLVIEGLAADIGLDRDGEAFLPGALERGIKTYMETNPLITYHHDPSKPLGRAVDYRFDDTKGKLWIRAEIDPPASDSGWHAEAYNSIKSGTTKGFSVGGVPLTGLQMAGGFKRTMTPDGPRIYDADVYEIAVTPLPKNPRTFFTVQTGDHKAVEVIDPNVWPEDAEWKALTEQVETLERVIQTLSDLVDARVTQ